MIKSYKNAKTRKVHETGTPKGFRGLDSDHAVEILDLLEVTKDVKELPTLKSYRLHKLDGNRKGQWSITVNLPWAVCFTPDITEIIKDDNGNVIDEIMDGWLDVEITDYHKG